MAVYVDPLMAHGGSATFRWKHSCHMYADSVEELMEFATKKVGLKAAWFQNKRVPHFDLNASRYRVALAAGAIQHSRREAVDFWVSKGWHAAKLRDMEFSDDDTAADRAAGKVPGPGVPGDDRPAGDLHLFGTHGSDDRAR